MKTIYIAIYEAPWNHTRTAECAFTTEAKAEKYLEDMYMDEDNNYENYKYDIVEIELDPEYLKENEI